MKKLGLLITLALSLGACTSNTNPDVGQELIENGGFESNVQGWEKFDENQGIATTSNQSTCIKSGQASAALSGVPDTANYARAFLQQVIRIPATGTATLRYAVRINSLEPSGSDGDKLGVYIDGSLTENIKTSKPRNVYDSYSRNLSDERGKDITLKFEVFNNKTLNTTFCLDDVSIRWVP